MKKISVLLLSLFLVLIFSPNFSFGQNKRDIKEQYPFVFPISGEYKDEQWDLLLEPYLIEFGVPTVGNTLSLTDDQYKEYKDMAAVISVPDPSKKTKSESGVVYVPFRTLNDEEALRKVRDALEKFAEHREKQKLFYEDLHAKLVKKTKYQFAQIIKEQGKALKLLETRGRNRRKAIDEAKIIIKNLKEPIEEYKESYQQLKAIESYLKGQEEDAERAKNVGKILVFYNKKRFEEAKPLIAELERNGFELVVSEEYGMFTVKGAVAELHVPHPDSSGFSILPYGSEEENENMDIEEMLYYLKKWRIKEYQKYLQEKVSELRNGGLPKETLFKKLEEEKERERKRMKEKAGVIGSLLQMKNNRLIMTPTENSPAQKAGLSEGDELLKVNDTDITNLDREAVIDLIRGPIGTSVKLTIRREGKDEPVEIIIIRGRPSN